MKNFINKIFGFLKPAPSKPLITDALDFIIKQQYKKNQETVFWVAIISYILYYFVRRNFNIGGSDMVNSGVMSRQVYANLGMIMGLFYGVSKFVMGNLGDRSNARWFLGIGLIVSAIFNFIFAAALSSIVAMMIIMAFIGWFQGMGWPATARAMSHWFSPEKKQIRMTIWNVSHNFGAGLIGLLATFSYDYFKVYNIFGNPYSGYYILPSIIALIGGVFVCIFMKDTPQSEGLPKIEDFSNIVKFTGQEVIDNEKEHTWKETLFKYVLKNKWLWIIAFANMFVYVLRVSITDWVVIYAKEAKGLDNIKQTQWLWSAYEWAAVPGTLLLGYIANRYFKGRLAPINILCIVCVLLSLIAFWLAPEKNLLALAIPLIVYGFFIYAPVAFIGMQAMDFTHKKAAATAAGLTGILGYIGDAVIAKQGVVALQRISWDATVYFLFACGIAAIALLSLVWNKSYNTIEVFK